MSTPVHSLSYTKNNRNLFRSTGGTEEFLLDTLSVGIKSPDIQYVHCVLVGWAWCPSLFVSLTSVTQIHLERFNTRAVLYRRVNFLFFYSLAFASRS